MFYCTKELFEHMTKKGRRVLSVEVASSDHSDFEVTEIFLRLVKDDFAVYLKEKKRYRSRELYLLPEEAGTAADDAACHAGAAPDDPTPDAAAADPVGEVLLPPYHLEIDGNVVFSLKKIWRFRKLFVEGIRL